MQQRYYDPIAGRFLSVDPVTTDAETGSEFGRYTYVDNNPYAKVDPDGRFGLPGAVAGALIEGGAQIFQGKWSGNMSVTKVLNNVKDIAVAGGVGAVTGGLGGLAAKAAIATTVSTGTAIAATAAAGGVAGAAGAVVSDALEIGGKVDANTGVKAAIGFATGALGSAAGAVIANGAAATVKAMGAAGGVMGHVAATTQSATNFGKVTGVQVGTSAGAEGAKTGVDIASTAASKKLEQNLTK